MLEELNPFLPRSTSTRQGLVDESSNDLGAEQLDEEDLEDQERDQDLEAVDPNEETWRRYLDWLKTVLSHFEAVRTLLVYVDGPQFKPYNTISMRILNCPPSGYRQLSWKVLLDQAQASDSL